MTINLGSVGRSPAGQRIHEAGLAYQSELQREEWERQREKERRKQEVAEEGRRRFEAQRMAFRTRAVQAALDAGYSDVFEETVFGPDKVRQIIAKHARAAGISYRAMLAKGRQSKLVRARQGAMYEAACETTYSLPQLARFFGMADHTTILYGIRQHAKRNGLELPRTMTPGTK